MFRQRLRQAAVLLPWALLPCTFLILMVFLPSGAVLQQTDTEMFRSVWDDGYMRGRIGWTVFQAAFTAVTAAVLSVPAARVLARFDFAGRKTLLRLLLLPFVMPTLVAGIGVLGLFGARGILWSGWEDTAALLLYGNIFFNLPVAIRAAYQGFCRVPASRVWAAQTLGASAWQRFWKIEFPVLLPWLAGGMCLIFLYCFSGFGLAMILGGEQYATVEVEIYRLIAYELDMEQAGALVLLSLAVTLVAGILYALAGKVVTGAGEIRTLPLRRAQGRERFLVLAAVLLPVLCCALPLAAVVLRALPAGRSWQVLAETDTLRALYNTLRFTAGAMIPALLLGISHAVLARRIAWMRSLTFLPFMVSPVCIAFGLLLRYPGWTASSSLLMAAYALLAYPFIAKDVLAARDALPADYADAARTLGASRFRVYRDVTYPLIRPALRRGLALSAATCVGEFAATLFLSRPEWETLTTLIYRYLGTPGGDNYDKAMVLTLLLMSAAILIFVVLEYLTAPPDKDHHADLG